ncbi:protein ALTERED PHOSPHATE STARVATION RESPONSE 1 [Malania oleifera]|uniref:protein ALTERED PHOSPHATE STARVATION RESPONSE 1 n=1 Tax=Malania oleifera TaxID=397392 RepID=UPI0025AE3747|nr:protein ALTERED PHOSPHATE STARVATION RESPONSE 1 [Malania oleifera]
MGCATSKVDDLPAVALCRDRLAFLDEAIRHRYALAEAHLAYTHSLSQVGVSLHEFFSVPAGDAYPDSSPVLNLPPQKKKADPVDLVPESSAAVARHSHSDSGSHLHFHSDSDDDYAASGSLHHSDHSSPLHDHGQHLDYADHEDFSFTGGGGGGYIMNINYMRNRTTPSVVYEQRPMRPETGHVGESSTYHPYNNNPSSSYTSYPYDGAYPNYGGGMNGYFGSQPPYGSPAPAGPSSSAPKSPPPPPSPPRSSPWDMLNFFETVENNYAPYTPSRDSKEVREEEGIPDLEDEYSYQQEVVKEVHGNQKYVDDGGGSSGGGSGAGASDVNYRKSVDKGGDGEALYQARPSISIENDGDPVEYEVHVVDKKVVDKEKTEEGGNVGGFKGHGGPRGVSEVVSEIQAMFERASQSGKELAKILEVGKLPYRKIAGYQVTSKMLHGVAPSLPVASSHPSASKNAESSAGNAALAGLEFDEDVGVRSINISSTLQKCYLWEKKLYDEVKAEEKLRVAHEQKCQKLKNLDRTGAEAHKVDSTRTLIRSLSTKIRIAIQVVDKISVKINKLRDEELWPQINELIQGLSRMWKSMLECHRSQCLVIREARSLDAIAFQKLSDSHLQATLKLEHELINWTLRFSSWIEAQKGYVRALNKWLMKCILYIPEETADGIVPFSPGRIGAPPLFVICNQWCQLLEGISEKEVIDSIRYLATSVLQLWKRDKLEMRQRMLANKDLEKKVKKLEREDQKIQKEIHALDKKMELISGEGNGLSITGEIVYQSDTSNSIQASLQHIFEAMERLAANSSRAYEQLLQRSEEERHAQEHAQAS